ncbi:MAG TPA: sugar MFS transporter [Pseudoxanthomonas sp.]|nr:sugar MFS transporter [Pseudoxanthomonas sp.]
MSAVQAVPGSRQFTSIAIIGLLFFIFGFVTWLNGPLIGFAELAFDVSEAYAFLIPSAFYISYFCLALPSSVILKHTGMKKGMALGLFAMAIGAVVFGQYTTHRWYPGALAGIFTIGAGLAILQTAANPYISILGPIEGAAQRIAVMGICNKIAGILAPLVLAAYVLHGMGDLAGQVATATPEAKEALLNEFAARIYLPYMAMAGLLVLLAIGILFSPLPEVKTAEANASSDAGDAAGKRNVFQYPHLLLGVICLFVYVGVEVLAGDAIGAYGKGFGLPLDETKMFTSYTLGAMLLGYVVGLIAIPRFISQERYLSVSAVLGIVFAIAAFLTHGYVSVLFVAALGFANAMMWPAIFPLAIKGLGRFTETGSALLIMGIAGGAVIPQLFAVFKQSHDFQWVFTALAVPCYVYILYFAQRGHRAGKTRQA